MARGAWRLPGYKVEDLIGAGSSGEVWRASVTSTGVPVALKRIWLSERAQREAAISEAAMLSALDHPHLMKLHELRPLDDAIVLVLDLAAAGSLATLLARRGRLTVGETVTALAPIGGALAYAHNAGVVHGDVSSANILFTEVGLPLLADLGVARLLGDAAAVRTTPSYADPAVAAGGVPTPASDVFMLGAVALHALTGAPPWPGDDAAEVLELAATTGDEPDFAARLDAAGVADRGRHDRDAGAAARARRPLHRGRVRARAAPCRRAGRGRADRGPGPACGADARVVAVRIGAAARTRRTRRLRRCGCRPSPGNRSPTACGRRHRSRNRRACGTRRASARVRRLALVGATASALVVAGVVRALATRLGSGLARRGCGAPADRRGRGRCPHLAASVADIVDLGADGAVTCRLDAAVGTAILTRSTTRGKRAYARRDPTLLSAVYSSALLLARDRDQLLSAVPPGCALTGLRTTFDRRPGRAAGQPDPRPRPGRSARRDARVPRARRACARRPGRPVSMTIDLHRTARRLPHRGRTSERTVRAAAQRSERPAQAGLDLGVLELEPGRGQRSGHRALAAEHLAGELAEHQPHPERRRRQHGRAVQHPSDRLRELGIGHRCGRGEVHRARRCRA